MGIAPQTRHGFLTMQKKLIFVGLSILWILQIVAHDPFAVVLMVKNEAAVIKQTLAPFISAGLSSFLIFDTGSTDSTVETAETLFKEHNISHWHIFQEPFIDFATSRNRALDLAEEHFPAIPFIVMPDAEWYLHNVEGLKTFCQAHSTDSHDCYLIHIANSRLDFTTPRLIRAHVGARFVGVVHEVIASPHYKKVPRDIFFELGYSRAGFEKSQQRWQRDLLLLLKSYQDNPTNPRTTFYLAQTYECLNDLEQAYHYYHIRTQQAGWLEENYETWYRLGRIATLLAKDHSTYTWHMAQDYYFKAHKILPHRAEPLVALAEHYWPDGAGPENVALCYLFAKRAYELEYPEHDLLFVDPEAYRFKRYDLLSKSAWHLGEFEVGETATRKALAYREAPHLLRNLAYYLEIKAR
jgi:glycosyltransferase involved in cell wall biosynthesis